MAAEKKKKNPYDFWVKFVLFLFIEFIITYYQPTIYVFLFYLILYLLYKL